MACSRDGCLEARPGRLDVHDCPTEYVAAGQPHQPRRSSRGPSPGSGLQAGGVIDDQQLKDPIESSPFELYSPRYLTVVSRKDPQMPFNLGDLFSDAGNVHSVAKWVRRGQASAADPADPNFDGQYNRPPVADHEVVNKTYRGFLKGDAVIEETDSSWIVSTPKPLPSVPFVPHAGLLQQGLQRIAPPPQPRVISKSEADYTINSRGLGVIQPKDSSQDWVYIRQDASIKRPSQQSGREQLQTLADIWRTRRWGGR